MTDITSLAAIIQSLAEGTGMKQAEAALEQALPSKQLPQLLLLLLATQPPPPLPLLQMTCSVMRRCLDLNYAAWPVAERAQLRQQLLLLTAHPQEKVRNGMLIALKPIVKCDWPTHWQDMPQQLFALVSQLHAQRDNGIIGPLKFLADHSESFLLLKENANACVTGFGPLLLQLVTADGSQMHTRVAALYLMRVLVAHADAQASFSMMPPWVELCCIAIKRPLQQVTLEELMLRLSASRMLLMLSEYASKYKELLTAERLQAILAAAWDAATVMQPHVQAIVVGSATDDAVCCDDDEGSVSIMACAVQNIELLRAMCSCKSKAVQALVQQAMGQVMALLVQSGMLTADQQQEIYADTDCLLDEEYQCTLRTTAQDAVLMLCSTRGGGAKKMPVDHLKHAFAQAAATAQQQRLQGDARWWMLLESALACIDKVGVELDFCVYSFGEVAEVLNMAMTSDAPLLSARALQVCASFSDERAMSSGRGISKQHLAPLLSLAVQRTAELQQPPVRIMAVQTVGSFLQRTRPEDVVELLPQLLQCLWPLAQAWSNASQVCVYDTLFTCYRMTMVLSRTHADVAQLVQGQAADVLQHCVQQFARHGDETSRDTAMKMAQVFSAHASCSQIVLAFALSSISSAFQQAAAPSETCSMDEVRELSLDMLTTHVRKCSVVLAAQQLQLLLPLLLQWLQSFAPDNDFVVPAAQSCSELCAAVMQFAQADALQQAAPVILAIVQWLLQPHLQERAILYAPKVFTQALLKLGPAADAGAIVVAMANRQVESVLPDLKYNVSVFLATMLKRDTVAVCQCIKAARPGRDGRSALSLIVEQWLNEVTLESLSKYEWKLRAVAMAQLMQIEDAEVMQMQSYNYDKQLQLSCRRILRYIALTAEQLARDGVVVEEDDDDDDDDEDDEEEASGAHAAGSSFAAAEDFEHLMDVDEDEDEIDENDEEIKSMDFEAWAHTFFASVRAKHPALFNSSFDGLQQMVSQRLWQLLLLP